MIPANPRLSGVACSLLSCVARAWRYSAYTQTPSSSTTNITMSTQLRTHKLTRAYANVIEQAAAALVDAVDAAVVYRVFVRSFVRSFVREVGVWRCGAHTVFWFSKALSCSVAAWRCCCETTPRIINERALESRDRESGRACGCVAGHAGIVLGPEDDKRSRI